MNPTFSPSALQANLNRIYDQGFASDFHEEFFSHSGFSNFGYWSKDTANATEAAEALVLKLLKPFLPLTGPVLDVACGQGGTTRTLTHFLPAEQITAINISPKQLSAAERNAPGCQFKAMSATELELPDNSQAGILCVEAIFHFETRRRFLKEAWRILQPGGWLALSDVRFRFAPPARIIPPANHFHSIRQYPQIFKDAGFIELQVESALSPTWKACSKALRHYAWQRLQKTPSPQAFKEWSMNEVRCKLYDAAIADYLLVGMRKPLA
jgi:MPBQ/MSBQ methyltransferase